MISVIIKDKPIANVPENPGETILLREIFMALIENARKEKRICQLAFLIKQRRSLNTMKKYFCLWYKCKEESKRHRLMEDRNQDKEERVSDGKIEKFVQALLQEKGRKKSANESSDSPKSSKSNNGTAVSNEKRATAVMKTPVKSRLQAQKLIIQEQKAKLMEQNKCIEEMKLKELDRQVKNSTKQTIRDAKEAMIKCSHQNRRNLVKILKAEGCRDKKIMEEKVRPLPKFSLRIEERIMQRRERMKGIELLHRQKLEEEKRIQEEARLKLEEQEMQRWIAESKKALRQRREQEQRRRNEIEKESYENNLADSCYKRYLFRRYFSHPLGHLISIAHGLMDKAIKHDHQVLLRKSLEAWTMHARECKRYKAELSSRFYRHNLLWYTYDTWKKIYLEQKVKYQTAVDYYNVKLLKQHWHSWHSLYVLNKNDMLMKEHVAIKHHKTYLKLTYFYVWRKYLLMADEIREKDMRREAWRQLVLKFVSGNRGPIIANPDFHIIDEYFHF